LDYGQEIDWNRSILQQMNELFNKVPHNALFNRKCVNSYYGNLQEDNRGCYMDAGGGFCRECFYGTINLYCKNVVDSHYPRKCELCYELIDCEGCYSCVYCQDCFNCLECYFCYDCRGCTNCFGCTNLRNAEYYWFNEKISAEEFKNKIKDLGKHSFLKDSLVNLKILKKITFICLPFNQKQKRVPAAVLVIVKMLLIVLT